MIGVGLVTAGREKLGTRSIASSPRSAIKGAGKWGSNWRPTCGLKVEQPFVC